MLEWLNFHCEEQLQVLGPQTLRRLCEGYGLISSFPDVQLQWETTALQNIDIVYVHGSSGSRVAWTL